MALTRLTQIDGFGQLELNNVTFRRDGRIEAQCALDATDFAKVDAENGMLLVVDKAKRVVRFPDADEKLPIALNYTTEHMYDERRKGLKNFSLPLGTFYPRLGFLSVGETFTTNCLAYDTDEFAADENVVQAAEQAGTTMLYGGACENGAIKVSATEPTFGPVLRAVEKTTMPDGQFAIKFQVIRA